MPHHRALCPIIGLFVAHLKSACGGRQVGSESEATITKPGLTRALSFTTEEEYEACNRYTKL